MSVKIAAFRPAKERSFAGRNATIRDATPGDHGVSLKRWNTIGIRRSSALKPAFSYI